MTNRSLFCSRAVAPIGQRRTLLRMDDCKEFRITPAMQGLALETALKRLLRDRSWSQVRSLIAG